MCEVCDIETYSSVGAYQYDPTRTTTLRNSFAMDMRRRFKKLVRLVDESIITNDCFGLQTPQTYQAATPNQFAFPTNDKKVQEFMVWFNKQVDEGILEYGELTQLGTSINSAWTNKYIFDSYQRGVNRAKYESQRVGVDVPYEDISIAMGAPLHIERLGILYSRTFSSLKGITEAMDRQVSIVLAQGLADGKHPRVIARMLRATITGSGMGDLGITDSLGRYIPAMRRAETLARTEIVRAHHQATINTYMNYRVAGVYVKAEFMTANDNRVCSRCSELEGNIYTLEEAYTLIPVHPNCRCMTLPFKEIDYGK